jgi:hypothetical protein
VRTWFRTPFLVVLLVIICYLIFKSFPNQITTAPPIKTPTSVLPAATSAANLVNDSSKCHIKGVLPDSSCTPGAIDPKVTQDTLFQTICKKGYT